MHRDYHLFFDMLMDKTLKLSTTEIPGKERERICHRFANAMLLPREALFEEIGIKRMGISLPELIAIKEQYGISVAAILMRMKDLGIISASYYKHL